MSKSQESIAKLFEENEMKVSRLYDLYSKAIPERADFWKKISQEEVGHANAIAEAFESEDINDSFEENNFTRGIIKYVSDFIDEQIENVSKKAPTQLEALQTSLRIEQSMIEKKLFEIFIPTTEKLRNVMEGLNKETEKHVKRLQEELEKIKVD